MRRTLSLQWAAYLNAMKRAVENNCKCIAFPLISSSIYGYPKDEALRVATKAICDFLQENDIDVFLVVFDQLAFSHGQALLGAVESYIDEHYVARHSVLRRDLLPVEQDALDQTAAVQLDGIVDRLDEAFAATLLRLIDSQWKE